MTTEAKRIALRLDSDPRLASAAGGAVRYLAEAAGMPEEVCREFQQATLQACLKVFAVQAAQSHLVELLVYGDRLEVAIDPASGAAAVKLTRSVVPSH